MDKLNDVYKKINKKSAELIKDGYASAKELQSAKNYVCSPDLKKWTFGKSLGYNIGGGAVKNFLYRLNFVDILKLKDAALQAKYIDAFKAWAARVPGFDIVAKFNRDQSQNKRFELLVHRDVLKIEAAEYTVKNSQQKFDEGFKTEITKEVARRDKRLIREAKEKYGTICAVCEFDFAETYPGHGDGFIEIHHLHPIAKGRRASTVEDVRPVCANCHRMLHRGDKILSITELKNIIVKK